MPKREEPQQPSLFDPEDPATQPGRVTAVVRRSIQIGDNIWCTFQAGIDLPPGATPEEVQQAHVTQQAVLQLCWDTTTGMMVDLLLGEAHRVTVPQMIALVRAMDRLDMSSEDLSAEALALGLPWPERGLTDLPFAAAEVLQDTLYGRLRAGEQGVEEATDAEAPAAGSIPQRRPAGRPAVARLTMENVSTVPIEVLGEVAVHWGKGREMGGWKGAKLKEIPPQNLVFFANYHGDGWQPNPHPRTGKIDPRDEILQAAARRYYEYLVEQRQEE